MNLFLCVYLLLSSRTALVHAFQFLRPSVLSLNQRFARVTRDSEDSDDYARKLSELDEVIAKAKEERRQIQLQKSLEKKAKKSKLLMPPPEWEPPKMQGNFPKSMCSKVSRSDAGTLVIEMTPKGVTVGTIFSGGFTLMWFSAIVPATLAGGLASAVFMLPFWLAGGMVAKLSVVDPFLSSKVTIGEFAWTLQKEYAGVQIGREQVHPTEQLHGATMELHAVVNEIPQYQLCLYGSNGVSNVGVGLPENELETVAAAINDFLEKLRDGDGDDDRADDESDD